MNNRGILLDGHKETDEKSRGNIGRKEQKERNKNNHIAMRSRSYDLIQEAPAERPIVKPLMRKISPSSDAQSKSLKIPARRSRCSWCSSQHNCVLPGAKGPSGTWRSISCTSCRSNASPSPRARGDTTTPTFVRNDASVREKYGGLERRTGMQRTAHETVAEKEDGTEPGVSHKQQLRGSSTQERAREPTRKQNHTSP